MPIRDAVPDDAESIRAVHRASITGLGPQAYDDEQVAAWARGCDDADYRAAIQSPELDYVVAERDGGIIGFGSLRDPAPDHYDDAVDVEITAVYVHPSVAREGVGNRITDELEARARNADATVLGLTASLPAVPFYASRGYERVKERTHEFSADAGTGVTGTVVEMRRLL